MRQLTYKSFLSLVNHTGHVQISNAVILDDGAAQYRGSTIGLTGCGIGLFFVVILGMGDKNRSGMREF